jgi:hypothetical protein
MPVKFPISKEASTALYGGDFSWAQRKLVKVVEDSYNSGKPVRVVVLKARQLGISTLIEAIIFLWAFIHKNSNGLVIAHENDTSQSLFEKTQFFWDTCPWHDLFTAKHATQRRIVWKETGSGIRIASAKNLGAARGRTLTSVHASECAQYIDAETLMIGLRQTMPNRHGTVEFLESTAQGIGNWFHHQWEQATDPDPNSHSKYVPLFFPWFPHYEYQIPTTICTQLELTAEEKRLFSLGASYEAIAWRRFEGLPNLCFNDEEFFKQEYPATAEEAFLTSGANVFPLAALKECYTPLRGHRGRLVSPNADGLDPRWQPDPFGPLTVFKKPPRNTYREDRFFIAGDPSMAVAGDPACAQVIDRSTMEQVAVWHGEVDPINFGKEMMLLGRWYHNAELCPEIEGGGHATIAIILDHGYPNVWRHRWADKAPGKAISQQFGFAVNYNRKHWAVGKLQYLVGEGAITIHDAITYHQMCNYIRISQFGELGPADPKGHDDAVMALAIAVFGSTTEEPYSEYERAAVPVTDIYEYQGR